MSTTLKPYKLITDYITDREVPNIGAEENRQALERFLVEEKGYFNEDIEVDVDIEITVAGDVYRSQIDLVISPEGGRTRLMAVKCAAGSLGSCEREIVAAARLLDDYQIPFAVVSDGRTAIILDTVSGKKVGEGLNELPTREAAMHMLQAFDPIPFPEERREREKLIFRTYDSANVNVQRNM